jgi:hypothetical protein
MDTAYSAYKIGVENYETQSEELPSWIFNVVLVSLALVFLLLIKFL